MVFTLGINAVLVIIINMGHVLDTSVMQTIYFISEKTRVFYLRNASIVYDTIHLEKKKMLSVQYTLYITHTIF